MTELPTLPLDPPSLFGIGAGMRELQEQAPITRVRTPAGDEAWLVTRYDEAKALFGDPRLGRAHPDPENAARVSQSALLGGATDNYDTEDTDHARMRSLLVPCFSARRMRMLKPRVEDLVDGLLDDLVAAGSPADLHEALSFPLPVLVICDLLGVPYADRQEFREWSDQMANLTDRRRSMEAMDTMVSYMRGLVARKRSEPSDDILSDLVAAEDDLTDDDIAGLGAVVLFAGHETTVVRIDFGTLLLLTNPRQREALLADPTRVPGAVEEILRSGTGNSGAGGLPRYARTDIEIGGVTIRAGEAVLLSINAANHDEQAFRDPDMFDIARGRTAPHLAFGHGARYCIGAALARIELTAVFERLFQRLPTLELAVPVERMRRRTNLLTGGLEELPVTW